MSYSENISHEYNLICAEILEPTMKQIALSFSVSTSEFYDTVHELSFSATRLMSEQAVKIGVEINDDDCLGYDRILEVVKSKERLYRLANRLRVDKKTLKRLDSKVLYESKIYDGCIYKEMVATYSPVSEMLGDLLFNKLDTSKVIRVLQGENREGFSFSEFAMYTCLYMSIKKSAVEVLNKPAETENQKKRLRGRMRLIKQWLYSEEFRNALCRTLLDLVAKFNEEEYNALWEDHIRRYWLPEEKQRLKHLDYAFDKYHLNFPDTHWRDHIMFVNRNANMIDNNEPVLHILFTCDGEEDKKCEVAISLEKVAELMRKCRLENVRLQRLQDFFFTILPTAELLFSGTVPKDLFCDKEDSTIEGFNINLKPYILNSNKLNHIAVEYVKRKSDVEYTIPVEIYRLAGKFCEVFETYIDAVIGSVVSFLECLPESEISGRKTLLEYLTKL